MTAIRQQAALAIARQAAIQSNGGEGPAHEQSASALSGTQFRAVRPDPAEAQAGTEGVLASAKLEGLRFEIDVGVWRGDSEHIAQLLIDDAECACGESRDD
jgi:hypothetical protein